MGRVRSAFDNALAESVFAALKTELIHRRAWPTRHELEVKVEVFSYLEGFYDTRRRHSRLNNLSPSDYETMHLTEMRWSTLRGSLQTINRAKGCLTRH